MPETACLAAFAALPVGSPAAGLAAVEVNPDTAQRFSPLQSVRPWSNSHD